MTFVSGKYYRNSLRLRDHDYSQNGMYFVTICTHQMQCLFGRIKNGEMYLNNAGKIVNQCWQEIPKHYPFVILGRYIIMPNHIHGIIQINHPVGANNHSPNFHTVNNCWSVGANNHSPLQYVRWNGTSKTVGAIVRGFKIGVTKWFRIRNKTYIVFQRNYYEHIVQDKFDLERI